MVWFTDADLRHLAGGRSSIWSCGTRATTPHCSANCGCARRGVARDAGQHLRRACSPRHGRAPRRDAPADAISVYRPLIEAAIAQTSGPGYARAAQLLLTVRPLFGRVGDDFARYVVVLKETNRRKRNLLAEQARTGL